MPDAVQTAGYTAADAARLREALLGQLAYLIDEIEALKAIVDCVPEPLQAGRPLPGERSMKETYGLLATLDETVYLPCVRRMTAEEAPVFDALEARTPALQDAWNEQPIDGILERVQEARRALLAFLRALPAEAWRRVGRFGDARRDVYELVHHITQRDVDLLRGVTHRLHESRLFTR